MTWITTVRFHFISLIIDFLFLACQTIDQVDCIFPFSYYGQTYNHCITLHNNGVPWCPTGLDNNGSYNGFWNNCGSGCSEPATTESPLSPTTPLSSNTSSDPCRTTSGPDLVGRACLFPFIYYGVTYGECTGYDNSGVLWCATQVDNMGNFEDGKWGNCSLECTSEV